MASLLRRGAVGACAAVVAAVVTAVVMHGSTLDASTIQAAPRAVPVVEWQHMKDSATASGELPLTPVLVRNSPMQEWWASSAGRVWDVASVAELAETTDAGDYNVTLQHQDHSTLFIPHKGLQTNGVTEPQYTTSVKRLREATVALWRRRPDRTNVYLSANVEDLPPAIASSVFDFLPQGCVRDELWVGGSAGLWEEADQNATCRGLRANLWLGSAATAAAMHFDLSHNLFFLSSGRKRFRLLPPSSHRAIRLHPSWHGSHLAAQAHPTDAQFIELGGYQVTLNAGDVLYLPPAWLHHVESVSHNVGLNIWTDSVASDAWRFLTDTERWAVLSHDARSCRDGGMESLFRCACAYLMGLHAELDRALGFGGVSTTTTGASSLVEHAGELLNARYDSPWQEDIASFQKEAARRARSKVARACDIMRGGEGLVLDELFKAWQTSKTAELARTLLMFDDGTRTLMLDEVLDAFSKQVVDQALHLDVIGVVPASAAAAAVEVFIRHCLVR